MLWWRGDRWRSGESLPDFAEPTGTTSYGGYIAVGTALSMWTNTTFWNFGMFFRQEEMRGHL